MTADAGIAAAPDIARGRAVREEALAPDQDEDGDQTDRDEHGSPGNIGRHPTETKERT